MINVCKHLGIQHVSVDFVKEYWNEVFIPFIDSYKGGSSSSTGALSHLLTHSLTKVDIARRIRISPVTNTLNLIIYKNFVMKN